MRRMARHRVVAVAAFDHGPGIWRGFEPHRDAISAAGREMVETEPDAMARVGGRGGQPPRLETGDNGLFSRLIGDGQANQKIPCVVFPVCRSGGRGSSTS